MAETYKLGLSLQRQRLVELRQSTNYGEIKNLSVRDGEPQFSPKPIVTRNIKLGSDSGPRPELGKSNLVSPLRKPQKKRRLRT